MVRDLIVEALGLDDLKLVLFQLQNEVVVGLATTKYVLYQIRVFLSGIVNITRVYLARFWYKVPTLVQLKYFRSESLGGLYSFSLCTMRKK